MSCMFRYVQAQNEQTVCLCISLRFLIFVFINEVENETGTQKYTRICTKMGSFQLTNFDELTKGKSHFTYKT